MCRKPFVPPAMPAGTGLQISEPVYVSPTPRLHRSVLHVLRVPARPGLRPAWKCATRVGLQDSLGCFRARLSHRIYPSCSSLSCHAAAPSSPEPAATGPFSSHEWFGAPFNKAEQIRNRPILLSGGLFAADPASGAPLQPLLAQAPGVGFTEPDFAREFADFGSDRRALR